MEPSSERRAETSTGVGFDSSGSVLAVGARTAVLDDVLDRTDVLRTYFDLVAGQRSRPLAVRADLRDRDLVSLASILDLPPVELERYIDRELARFVANTEAALVVDLTAPIPAVKKRRVRPLILAVGALSIGAAVVLANMAEPDATPAAAVIPAETPTTQAGAGTVRIEPDPDGTGNIVIVESPPAPAAADGTEIGSAVRVYREP